MGAGPGGGPCIRFLATTTDGQMRMKRPQINRQPFGQHGVVDPLTELIQPGMTGTYADPQDAGNSFGRENAGTFDGERERFNVDGRNALHQLIARARLGIADKTERDVKLFQRCPPDVAQRRTQCGHRCSHRFRGRDRDEQSLGVR